MFWVVTLVVLAFILFALVAYLIARGKDTDIPSGWHPPGGDHTAGWIGEHYGDTDRPPGTRSGPPYKKWG